jgi:NADH-quinone oxidoreductase subunit H
MLIFILSIVVVYLIILLAIAFITLLERKLLGLSQDRLSPNKVLFKGTLQPLLDGVKLIVKIVDFIQQRNQKLFTTVAVLRFRFFLVFIRVLPFFISNLKLG